MQTYLKLIPVAKHDHAALRNVSAGCRGGFCKSRREDGTRDDGVHGPRLVRRGEKVMVEMDGSDPDRLFGAGAEELGEQEWPSCFKRPSGAVVELPAARLEHQGQHLIFGLIGDAGESREHRRAL